MESERISELEAKVEELTALVQRLTSTRLAPAAAGAADAAVESTSRRHMLRNVALAAGGAVAATVAGSGLPAAAEGADDLQLGTVNVNSGRTTATYAPPASATTGNGFLFQIGTNVNEMSSFQSALAAWTTSASYPTGFYAFTTQAAAAVQAVGAGAQSLGVRTSGARANVLLTPGGVAAPSRTDGHTTGELVEDTAGSLWLCVADGTPGTWRKLAGPATSGAFHSIAPVRGYDSRLGGVPSPGRLSSGENRVISIKDARNEATGDVTTANVVPAGATAIVCNLTVTDTAGSLGGFLSVVPGDALALSGSSINWFGPGQNIANGVTAKVAPDRTVKVFAAGSATSPPSTHFVIDVNGYYL